MKVMEQVLEAPDLTTWCYCFTIDPSNHPFNVDEGFDARLRTFSQGMGFVFWLITHYQNLEDVEVEDLGDYKLLMVRDFEVKTIENLVDLYGERF